MRVKLSCTRSYKPTENTIMDNFHVYLIVRDKEIMLIEFGAIVNNIQTDGISFIFNKSN